jgi:hypothetical protein
MLRRVGIYRCCLGVNNPLFLEKLNMDGGVLDDMDVLQHRNATHIVIYVRLNRKGIIEKLLRSIPCYDIGMRGRKGADTIPWPLFGMLKDEIGAIAAQ